MEGIFAILEGNLDLVPGKRGIFSSCGHWIHFFFISLPLSGRLFHIYANALYIIPIPYTPVLRTGSRLGLVLGTIIYVKVK